MFGAVLDVIVFFALTNPIVGWATLKFNFKWLCGVYSLAGLSIAGVELYEISNNAFSRPLEIPLSPMPFESYLRIDALSIFMSLTFILIGFFVTAYSIRFMENESGAPLYYTSLLLMIAGMIGVVSAGDFFTFFIFWELMCISSYVLVSFRKQHWEPVEAGMKYLIMSSAGSAAILFALSLLYGLGGTLDFIRLADAMRNTRDIWIYAILTLMLLGFGVKSAIVPLHTWLPDAYSAAPSPISAILSGVVTETGIYALCRVLSTLFISLRAEWSMILAALSIITMTFGNIVALLQVDLKRLLAYSSIGHIGYMLAGVATGTPLGLTGALLHIFNHALMKGNSFLCAGAFIYRIGGRRLDEIAGAGRRMPATATALGISLFALTGMPPLNGFISELTIFTSTIQAGMAWLGVCIILNSAISAGYVLRVIRALLQTTNEDESANIKEAPTVMLLPILLMSALVLLFGVWPDPVLKLAMKAASTLVLKG